MNGVQEVPCVQRGELCGVYGPTIRKIHQAVVDKRYGLGPDRTGEIYSAFVAGREYPRPLNRSVEGIIFKYFAEYTGKDELYIYATLREKSLEQYERVCPLGLNINLKANNEGLFS